MDTFKQSRSRLRTLVMVGTRTLVALILGATVGIMVAGTASAPAESVPAPAHGVCRSAVDHGDQLVTAYANAYGRAVDHGLTDAEKQQVWQSIDSAATIYTSMRDQCWAAQR